MPYDHYLDSSPSDSIYAQRNAPPGYRWDPTIQDFVPIADPAFTPALTPGAPTPGGLPTVNYPGFTDITKNPVVSPLTGATDTGGSTPPGGGTTRAGRNTNRRVVAPAARRFFAPPNKSPPVPHT